jgi:YbbR domain-containing protein
MLTKNLPLKLAALGLAVFLWFWVLLKEQNLIPEHTVRTAIVEEGMGAGLALASPLPQVEVRVRGLRDEISDVENSLEAYVMCRGLGPGRHTRPVEVRTPANVNLVGVRPAEVTVVLEEVITAGRRVDLDLRGEPPAGYELTGVDASPKTVDISGARSTVERVSRARATLDLARAVPEVQVSLPVEVLDGSGKVVEGVEVEPERVNVLTGLKLVVSSRTVPVVVRTRGALPGNVKLTSVQVEPAMVTIVGPANRVQDVGRIDTEELVLTTVTGNFTRRLALIVPEEVNLLSDPSAMVTVKVTVPQPAAPPQDEAAGQSGG